LFSPTIAYRETAALAAVSQVDLCLSARPAPRPNKAQSSDAYIDITVDPPRAKDRTLRRQSVDNGRVANVHGSMNRVDTQRARDASARSTPRAAFGTVDREQLQIDRNARTSHSMSLVIMTLCVDRSGQQRLTSGKPSNKTFAKICTSALARKRALTE